MSKVFQPRRGFTTQSRVAQRTLGKKLAFGPNPEGIIQIRIKPMPQSLVQIYVHIVFSTKHRQALLQDSQLRKRLHAYLAGICKNLQCPTLIIGGIEDHVHLLCRWGKNINIADFILETKRDSSKWIKAEQPSMADFYWQNGYGAFSISPAHVEALKEYITNQEEHHRRETFQKEFRRLCKKYGLAIDERYVWD